MAALEQSAHEPVLPESISAAQLHDVLVLWLPTLVKMSAKDDCPAAIDLTVIDALCELDDRGGMGLVNTLFTCFLESAEDDLGQIRSALAAGDATALAQIAHRMKSSTANLGALPLSAFYRELEASAREVRIDAANALLDRIRCEHRRVVARMRDLQLERS